MKVVTVVGARPQIIKAAVVGRELEARGHHEVLVHTGQQTAAGLADDLVAELGVSAPVRQLRVDTAERAEQIARMTSALEPLIRQERPDWMIVFGDTNSTLAGALAASAAGVRLVHVEAGVRSFNLDMPEEHNRIETDRRSALLCCPGERARTHLLREGITDGVHVTGDVMFDAFLASRARADRIEVPARPVEAGPYLLATVHRAATTDDPVRLMRVLSALDVLPYPVVLPLHPRTSDCMNRAGFCPSRALRIVAPLGHRAMLDVLSGARALLTDSGGLQKEAYWLGVPCLTLRHDTEWMETVEAGWNHLVGDDPARIARAVGDAAAPPSGRPSLFEQPGAAVRTVALMEAGSQAGILRRFSGSHARRPV